MDANKSVTATFAALPADRCATTTAADCIRAVYLGTPGDYAQVTDIPADKLVAPAADGRYYVGRGQQLTVVTAAPLPADWTRFYLQWSPLEFGTPSPVSSSQLIKPVGTTYTFTVSDDEAASTLITFDLRAARPFVRPRPDGKPELGDVVVTTVFSVETTTFRYDTFDTTGAVAMAGSYGLPLGPRRHDNRCHHLRGAPRRHDYQPARPPVRRPRRVADGTLRHGGGGRHLRVARG